MPNSAFLAISILLWAGVANASERWKSASECKQSMTSIEVQVYGTLCDIDVFRNISFAVQGSLQNSDLVNKERLGQYLTLQMHQQLKGFPIEKTSLLEITDGMRLGYGAFRCRAFTAGITGIMSSYTECWVSSWTDKKIWSGEIIVTTHASKIEKDVKRAALDLVESFALDMYRFRAK